MDKFKKIFYHKKSTNIKEERKVIPENSKDRIDKKNIYSNFNININININNSNSIPHPKSCFNLSGMKGNIENCNTNEIKEDEIINSSKESQETSIKKFHSFKNKEEKINFNDGGLGGLISNRINEVGGNISSREKKFINEEYFAGKMFKSLLKDIGKMTEKQINDSCIENYKDKNFNYSLRTVKNQKKLGLEDYDSTIEKELKAENEKKSSKKSVKPEEKKVENYVACHTDTQAFEKFGGISGKNLEKKTENYEKPVEDDYLKVQEDNYDSQFSLESKVEGVFSTSSQSKKTLPKNEKEKEKEKERIEEDSILDETTGKNQGNLRLINKEEEDFEYYHFDTSINNTIDNSKENSKKVKFYEKVEVVYIESYKAETKKNTFTGPYGKKSDCCNMCFIF